MGVSSIKKLSSGFAKVLVFQPASVDRLGHRPKHGVHGGKCEQGYQEARELRGLITRNPKGELELQ